MSLPTINELLQSGVHFGHQKRRWHPKMKPYLFSERNGIYIIDLEKTLEKLDEAVGQVQKITSKGGNVLFVGTKKQGQKIFEKYAQETGMPYVTERWVGGFFTNFANVSKLIKKYRSLKEQRESGALHKYTKKEQSDFGKEIEKLDKIVGGLSELTKLPEAIFVLDVKKEKTAIAEARKKGIAIIGFCDANANPDMLDFPIPANDDAVKSIEIITKTIAEAIKEGKKQAETK